MLRVVVTNPFQMEQWTVLYHDGSQEHHYTRWSREDVMAFIARKWPHVPLSEVKVTDLTSKVGKPRVTTRSKKTMAEYVSQFRTDREG